MSHVDHALGRLVSARGLLTEDEVRDCLREAKQSPTPRNLAQMMVEKGKATPQQVEALLKEVGAADGQPAAPSIRLGPNMVFGKYQILSELGRGGMGAVYKACDTALDRIVALKILSDRLVATEEDVHRFQRESKLAARLNHPHLVPVFEADIFNGVPFFTMEYIEGETLDSFLADALACEFRPDWQPRIGRDEIVRIMIKVAEAVHVAHRAGIIHRDLKPANIIIDAQNEPHVMDFGLAKEVNSMTWLTSTGVAMGTPYYMPPEQARGEVRDLDVRADVYALGAVLYHSLTLKLPFGDASGAAVLRKVIDEDPVRPRVIDATIDRKVEKIVLKAMAKERKDRYPTAGDFARDLERFLNGQPIAARGPSMLQMVKRWIQKNPAWAGSIGVASLLLAVFASYLFLRPGRITIETVPAGADVFIDGASIAEKTPLKEYSLRNGRHQVRISKPGWREETLTIDLAAGGREVRPLKLEQRQGTLTLMSTPTDVEVRLSGPKRLSTRTPIEEITFPEGRYRIEAFQDGFQLGVIWMDVRDRAEVVKKFALLPAQRWTARTSAAIGRRIAMADLDRDGVVDAVVASEDGKLRAYSGKTGAPLWQHDTKYAGPTEPVFIDVDGDGVLDILFGLGTNGFQCLRSDGTPRYNVRLPDRTFVSPASVDVNKDGAPDLVTASWDGQVSCFSGKALLALKADRLWAKPAGGRVVGAPMVADDQVTVVTDRRVVVYALATGAELRSIALPFVPTSWRVGGGHIIVGCADKLATLRLSDGGLAWTTPMKTPVTSIGAPAEILSKRVVVIGTEDGAVLALELATGAELWMSRVDPGVRSAPVIVDLDGDGAVDVVLGCDSSRLCVLDGRTGVQRWGIATAGKVQAEVTIADVTGDGIPEIIYGTKDGAIGAVSLSSR